METCFAQSALAKSIEWVEKEQSRQAGWKRDYSVFRAACARFTAQKGDDPGRRDGNLGARTQGVASTRTRRKGTIPAGGMERGPFRIPWGVRPLHGAEERRFRQAGGGGDDTGDFPASLSVSPQRDGVTGGGRGNGLPCVGNEAKGRNLWGLSSLSSSLFPHPACGKGRQPGRIRTLRAGPRSPCLWAKEPFSGELRPRELLDGFERLDALDPPERLQPLRIFDRLDAFDGFDRAVP